MLRRTICVSISVLLFWLSALAPAIGQAKLGEFLLISDIHFDPFHDPSVFEKLDTQPVEHWETILESSQNKQFSQYGQDTNYSLLRSTLDDAVKRIPDPDFILYPGDSLAHNWHKKYDALSKVSHQIDPTAFRKFKTKATQFVARAFARRWPNTPILATLGNNDSYCGDYRIEPQGPFLSMFADAWAPLLEHGISLPAFRRSFSNLSLYDMRIPTLRHQRIIAIDNVYWSTFYDNACGVTTQTPALDQLAWLEKALRDSQAADEKVWLLLHVPLGIDSFFSSKKQQGKYARLVTFWQQALTSRFAQLVERYQSTIQIAFAGHTHMDDFRIVRLNGKASLLMKIAPSVSPVFGNNPAYQIYDYDCDSGKLENYRTFSLKNLSVHRGTDSDAVSGWDMEYDFRQAYRLSGLSAATIEQLVNHTRKNDVTRKAFAEFYDVGGPTTFSAKTVYDYGCAILSTTPAAYQACLETANPAR